MGRVLLTTFGTWGDLFPLVGVASELQRRGHHVDVGAPPVWRGIIEGARLGFVSLGDTATFAEFEAHPEVLAPLPWGLREAMRWFMFDGIDSISDALAEAMVGVDVVVTHPAHIAAHNVAEKMGIRRVVATVFPTMIPSGYSVPGGSLLGPWSGPVGRLANRGVWATAKVGTAVLFDGPINRHRKRLGLAPVRAGMIELPLRAAATVVMASPAVIGHFPDWPSNVTVTSFVDWDDGPARGVPDSVERFLEAGEPPVLITLGASGAIEPEDFLEAVTAQVLALGYRALVATGPARPPKIEPIPGRVEVAEYVPFSRVGPRCAVAVHHAGIGTTASFIKAGIPQLLIPKGFDQPLTAARAQALGVGIMLPWTKRHTRLRQALTTLLADRRYSAAAATLARNVGPVDGALASADQIERHISDHLSHPTRDA